jgi:hypothetical protein
VGLRLLACSDCGFESPRGHGCLSVVSVVCCQVEVSLTVEHSSRGVPPSVVVSECDHYSSTMRGLWPTRGCRATKFYMIMAYVRRESTHVDLRTTLLRYWSYHKESGLAVWDTLCEISQISKHIYIFLILSFRRVLHVMCFLLGVSPASDC